MYSNPRVLNPSVTATTTLFTSARGIVSPLRNDKGTGAEIRVAIVFGIATEFALVSYWLIVPCP